MKRLGSRSVEMRSSKATRTGERKEDLLMSATAVVTVSSANPSLLDCSIRTLNPAVLANRESARISRVFPAPLSPRKRIIVGFAESVVLAASRNTRAASLSR